MGFEGDWGKRGKAQRTARSLWPLQLWWMTTMWRLPSRWLLMDVSYVFLAATLPLAQRLLLLQLLAVVVDLVSHKCSRGHPTIRNATILQHKLQFPAVHVHLSTVNYSCKPSCRDCFSTDGTDLNQMCQN